MIQHLGKDELVGGTPGHKSSGPILLGFVIWLRSQHLLHKAYRKLPLSWRSGMSALLAKHIASSLRFPRTKTWERPLTEVESVLASVSAKPVSTAPGVNILGFVRGEFGLGESARMYARSLADANVPVTLFDVCGKSVVEGKVAESYASDELPYQACLIFVNPDRLSAVLDQIGEERLRGKHLIVCWFWELECIPETWLPAIERIDEIMVPSRFIGQALMRVTDKPLLHVPQPLCVPIDSGLKRVDFGLEEGKFIFFTAFDFNSDFERKNPLATILAFLHAFPRERDDVRLLVKSINGSGYPLEMARMVELASDDSRITIRDETIDRAHVVALQRCCDAFVSLHRAEGFGLVLAECMAMAKPVIATGWSGNMDFMNDCNSCLVGYQLVSAVSGQYGGGEKARWAEPDIDHAATYMRRLVDDPEFAAIIGSRAAADVRYSNAGSSAAFRIGERLKELGGLGQKITSAEGAV